MNEPKKIAGNTFDSPEIAEAYLAAIIQSSYDAIIAKRLDGTITSWNNAAEKIFGYSSSEAMGQHISLIIPQDRLDEETQIISQLRAGNSINHFETVRRAKDGRMIDLSITVSPIRNGAGEIIGASKVARDITAQKSYARALQKANEDLEEHVAQRTRALEEQSTFLKAILNNISDGIVACDENGVLNLFNRSTSKFHGLPHEALPPEQWADYYNLLNPDGETRMAKEDIPLFRALAEGSVQDAEMVIAPHDGVKRTLVANGQALVDETGRKFGAVVSMHDVTQQKKNEKALIESRTFLRAIIDTVADPIFVKDSGHRWIEGNKAFWELLGPEEDIRGKTDYDLFPKEQADLFWEGDNKIFETGEPYDAEETLRGRDGNNILIRTRKMPFTMANGEKALVGIIRDVTQQRQFEEELRQHRVKMQELVHIQTRELVEAKERAEEASKAQGEFIANMSHEIRTPMNAVVGIARILEDSRVDPLKQKELLKTLTLSAHQLMDLINDLLDAAKIHDSSFSLESVPFDLKKVIAEVVSINTIEAQNKKVSLDYDYKCRISTMFMGDPVRLRQVVMNLVGNALKFTSEGSVHIGVDCSPSHQEGLLNVRIDVIDTGIGIAKEVADSIFDRFKQADSKISKIYGGTGLGLSISKQLAEMMGGSISVRSEVGKGSCFSVDIPLSIAGEASAIAKKFSDIKSLVKDGSERPCILLVEDYEPNILVTSMLLEEFGYRCVVARNGSEAIERLAQGGVDLVLMDVQMPTMDGFTATRLWRETEAVEHMKRTPIIGMTAHALQGDRERCEVSGMDEYISKPFDANELQAKVTALLVK